MKRPLCKKCQTNPRAYAYKKDNKIYWRSMCDACIRKKNKQAVGGKTRWQTSGYQKKPKCELCGFKAVVHEQLNVYHVNGNKNDCNIYNLKTICANCQRLKSTQELGWSIGDLEVDE